MTSPAAATSEIEAIGVGSRRKAASIPSRPASTAASASSADFVNEIRAGGDRGRIDPGEALQGGTEDHDVQASQGTAAAAGRSGSKRRRAVEQRAAVAGPQPEVPGPPAPRRPARRTRRAAPRDPQT